MPTRRNHRPNEFTRFSRVQQLDNLELLTARFTRQTFAPHFHEGHVIGVIEKGALGFDYRGEKLVAAPGQINLADPGEVHNGFSASGSGWQYRMFYLTPGQLESILGRICEKEQAMPFFKKGVIRDRALARSILELHRGMTDPSVSLLEKESRFYGLVHEMVRRHIPGPLNLPALGPEPRGIARIKDYIRDNAHTRVSLADLSRVAGMSKYYMLRVFKARTGMTPHAFLNQARACKARQLLSGNRPLADIALACGFFDQSHMNRIFKKVFGITPGQYAGAVLPRGKGKGAWQKR